MTVRTHPNRRDPDQIYNELIQSFGDLEQEAALALAARLILLLANQIDDDETVLQAIALASGKGMRYTQGRE